MTRLRFPVSAVILGCAAGSCTLSAFGQELRAETRIEDIQISQASSEAGGGVAILVKLSQQPKSAVAAQIGGALVVDIDGVFLPALAFDPAGNAMVRHVAVTPSATTAGGAPGSKIRFEGAAFTGASTTIYRDAVLIEAKLAEASLPAGASLMIAVTPSKTAPAKPAPLKPAPVAAHVPAAKAIPTIPIAPVSLAPLAPAPADLAPLTRPVDVKSAEAKSLAAKNNVLESHPPVAPAPSAQVATASPKAAGPTAPLAPPGPLAPQKAVASLAGVAKLDADACAGAEEQLAKDAWSLPALGNRALCLIDQQKFPEAKNRLDQLAAFSPEDWRVDLGRAALATQQGNASQAEIGYRNAAQLAPDEATRSAILQMVTKLMGPAIN